MYEFKRNGFRGFGQFVDPNAMAQAAFQTAYDTATAPEDATDITWAETGVEPEAPADAAQLTWDQLDVQGPAGPTPSPTPPPSPQGSGTSIVLMLGVAAVVAYLLLKR